MNVSVKSTPFHGRKLVLGIALAVIFATAGKLAYDRWQDRQALNYVLNRSGLILPVGSKIIVREEKSSIIPSDGYGAWVIELPDDPKLVALQQCASPGFAKGGLVNARLDFVLLEKFVGAKDSPVCYRAIESKNGSEIEIFVIQGRKLVYFYKY